MRRLQVDEYWGRACIGYHVQARPSRASRTMLSRMQQDVARAAPVALNLIRADALHLSVTTLVPAQTAREHAELQWTQIEPGVHRVLSGLSECAELSIHFEHLAFTPRAVIVLTRDQPSALLEAREHLCELMTSCGLTCPRYDQAHVTLARYAESVTLDEASVRSIERDELALEVTFEPFRLVRERRYPSLQTEPA